MLFHRIGFNYISSGPLPLVFSILYQYSRVVPSVYNFRIFGVSLSNKSFIYLLALQVCCLRSNISFCSFYISLQLVTFLARER